MNHFRQILRTLRPRQWLKNILLFGGLYFPESQTNRPLLFHPNPVKRALIGFVAFCAISSTIYILNDIIDAPRDRLHPRKRNRPIASGQLSPTLGAVIGIVMGIFGLAISLKLSYAFFLCTAAYVGMMVAYTIMLKELFLIDTMIISMGFIIRAVSGVIVLRTPTQYVELTPWFVICVLFLSLLLAFCKRRVELLKLEDQASSHRLVLREYSHQVLDLGIGVCATATILAYALYATSHPRPWSMLTTLPFVLYGVFRYLHLVYTRHTGDAPEEALLEDHALMGCIVLWGLSLLLVFYPGG